jgi:creatinine amidohydrolase
MELLRPGELTEERARVSLVYAPVGPVEWHSYHMPVGTDALIAQETARRAAQITGGVVAPTLFVGTETLADPAILENLNVPDDGSGRITGMDFPANTVPSLYYREEVFAAVAREELRLLARMGYRMIVVVNGHGAKGQVRTLRRLCGEVSRDHGVCCVYPDDHGKRMGRLIRKESMDPGHADRLETALMMAVTDSVDLARLPARPAPLHSADFGIASGSQFGGRPPRDGVVRDDPRGATAELGNALLTACADDLAEYVTKLYRERVEARSPEGR